MYYIFFRKDILVICLILELKDKNKMNFSLQYFNVLLFCHCYHDNMAV